MTNTREVCIKSIRIIRQTDSVKNIRISFVLMIDGTEHILWFEVERKWAKYLSADRCDAAVVCIFYYAVRFNYDIKLECPISEILYYQLQYQIIPQLHAADQRFHKITIYPDKLLPKYRLCKNATGMGMSLGVDSFATLYEYNYSELKGLERYRVTHFTYHQVGAHHGLSRGKQGPIPPQMLFEEELQKVKNFCAQYHYPLIVITSNLNNILEKSFPFLNFWASYSFRNTGAALLLQRLFSKFYLSSGFNLNEFACGIVWDCGRYDPVTLPLLSTENIRFYRTNQDWSRIQKIKLLSEFAPSYDYLTVCMTHSKNCGICEKCRPTLLAMDVLGVLDLYANSFDIEKYQKDYRSLWLEQLWEEYPKSVFMREILEYALEIDFTDLPKPKLFPIGVEPTYGIAKGIYMRKFPHRKSRALVEKLCGKIQILGKSGDWYYVKTSSGKTGFCFAEYVQIATSE